VSELIKEMFEEKEQGFSKKEMKILLKRKKLIDEIDELCQQLYDQPIDVVYWGYEEFDEQDFKKIIKELREKLGTLKKAEEGVKEKYDLKKAWQELYDMVIIDQPLYRDLYFYGLIGQVFFWDFKVRARHKDEDLRIHPVLIGPTGIGKTESNNLLAEIITQIPKRKWIDENGDSHFEYFKAVFPKQLTDQALIGSIDSALLKEQKMKRIKKTDERYIEPIQWGAFYLNDFIIFDEAEVVFKPGKWSERLQINLRTVMNRYGTEGNHISNDSLTARGMIGYYPTCSIILTSYYMPQFETVFMEGGLMQRTALIVDEEDPEKREKIQDEQINGVENRKERKFEIQEKKYREAKEKFISMLTELKMNTMTFIGRKWNPSSRKMISFPENVRKKIKEHKNRIRNIIPLTISQKEKFDSLLGRLTLTFFKVCALNAIIEKRTEVEEEDVDEAFLLIRQLAISSAEFIKTSMPQEKDLYSKMEKDLVMVLRTPMTKTELNKTLASKWGVSLPTAITRLKKLREKGLFEMIHVGEGNQKICKLKRGIKLEEINKQYV